MDNHIAQIMAYSKIVGQEDLKLALELSYIAPSIGGVLISGQKGTAKSTTVRAFGLMMWDKLPVTLPINATEDRVIGGWKIDELLKSNDVWQPGVLTEANNEILYIDEVNLLEDHIVNIILDVSSTGVLVVQREGKSCTESVTFSLIGTMNPDEGGLRPQLLDRFGLLVEVRAEAEPKLRAQILNNVLDFDQAILSLRQSLPSNFLDIALGENRAKKKSLEEAKARFENLKSPIEFPADLIDKCVDLAEKLRAEGHRGDYVCAYAAKALAAREGEMSVSPQHLQRVARLAFQHRTSGSGSTETTAWTEETDRIVNEVLDVR
jgi:magnesium chelatase subunit I